MNKHADEKKSHMEESDQSIKFRSYTGLAYIKWLNVDTKSLLDFEIEDN